ncbi:hypothetical protein DBR40_09080 [Pedobacter sp. KBW01]|uniref:lipoprotein n=1 Tax=Pedobacter sp. KBW01 TaxID=2153364 RepID=UPI000F59F3D3|nr:lipoprotein [Pedobacter sp. KBW01]RQO78092.1 hypothetical protein DBR40_09080 [Pedobacter sp. KBW01]
MKKTLIVLLALAALSSCINKKGDVKTDPTDLVEINGKVIQAMQVVPCDGCSAIWIAFAKDSTESPVTVNYKVRQNKTFVNKAVVVFK